jgi:hypothetical protein
MLTHAATALCDENVGKQGTECATSFVDAIQTLTNETDSLRLFILIQSDLEL